MEPGHVENQGTVLACTRLRGHDSWVVLVRLSPQGRVLARSSRRPALGESCEVYADGGERFRAEPVQG